jgi:hypothetical protein
MGAIIQLLRVSLLELVPKTSTPTDLLLMGLSTMVNCPSTSKYKRIIILPINLNKGANILIQAVSLPNNRLLERT